MANGYTGSGADVTGLRFGGKRDVSIRQLLGDIEREQGEESTFQGLASLGLPVAGSLGGKALSTGIASALGVTISPFLLPFIMAAGAYGTKKGVEHFARKGGAGGEPEEITGDFYTRKGAYEYRKGLKDVQEETEPKFLQDLISSYTSALTPQIAPVFKDGKFSIGQKGGELLPELAKLFPSLFGGQQTYKYGGQVPKYEGGGSVYGDSNTPTIYDYFERQGKTISGGDTQSLAEKLGRT